MVSLQHLEETEEHSTVGYWISHMSVQCHNRVLFFQKDVSAKCQQMAVPGLSTELVLIPLELLTALFLRVKSTKVQLLQETWLISTPLLPSQVAKGSQHTGRTSEEGGKAEQGEHRKKTREYWKKKQFELRQERKMMAREGWGKQQDTSRLRVSSRNPYAGTGT